MTVNSNYSAYSSYGSSSVTSSVERGKPNFEEMANELLTSMDSDSNGSIDKAEFIAAAQSETSQSDDSTSLNDIFSLLDTDGSGSMSSEELINALKNMKPEGAPPPPPPPQSRESESSEDSTSNEIFAALDTNEDGVISADEFEALFADDSSKTTASDEETTKDNFDSMKNDIMKKVLSYYSNSISTTNSESMLSVSA